MLTGDENIIDVHCVVFWRIRNAQHYLFNIQNPEITVKDVAESAIRDIVGQSNIQPLLTGARQKTEQAVQKLMQIVLDSYGAGVSIDQVQLQKVDPPTQVIDAFRDVQAARADQQRLQNEAGSYASKVVPEARGEAERILQGARAYKEQTVRSEEHTSELQSHSDLVCRLLLEKKNQSNLHHEQRTRPARDRHLSTR